MTIPIIDPRASKRSPTEATTTEVATKELSTSQPATNDDRAKPESGAAPPVLEEVATTTRAAGGLAGPPAKTAGGAAREAIRSVGRHPFRAIAAATLAGALIQAELAVTLGVVAIVIVLLATPNGAQKRRELDRRLRRLGRGAVTAIRERLPADPGTTPDPGAQPPRE